jgi:hypothetical protein
VADITHLDPTDYFLYLPLLPQVAVGVLEPRCVTVSQSGTLTYDRLVLAVGGVNKLLPVPGVAEYAHGFRGLPEALYLRVGAGCTGTEVAARGSCPPTRWFVGPRCSRAGTPPTPWVSRCPAPSPGPPEPARVADSPGVFASRPEGET